MTMKKRTAIITVLTILMLVLMTACGGQNSDDGEVSGKTENPGNSENNEVVAVDTSYGDVEYPIGYEEIVLSEQTVTDNSEEHVFYALLNGEKIKVYTITFSQSEFSDKGDLIGTTINEDGETINIYLLPEENIVDEDMPDDDKKLVYAAQETLNDVVTSLSKWDDYKPADQ